MDIRAANEAIRQERHITPTVEGMRCKVPSSSPNDLNSAYHQIKFVEESRYITTFSIHVELRRYHRIKDFLGISCAHEILHNVIKELLSYLEGVINTSDDIVVDGKTEEELCTRTKKVEDTLKQNNLTTNLKKRQECKKEVKFFGVNIPGEGVKLDPKKNTAVVAFKEPKSKTEIKSFVGLTNYCSRSIPS